MYKRIDERDLLAVANHKLETNAKRRLRNSDVDHMVQGELGGIGTKKETPDR